MKKVLLGTTAIIGATMIALPAVAADPIKLGLGGYHNVRFGANLAEDDSSFSKDHTILSGTRDDTSRNSGANSKDSGELDILLEQDTEIFFTGETELENGLTFGFVTQLEMDNGNNATKDESFMYIRGGFGQLTLGDNDGAADIANVAAPMGSSMFSALSNNQMMDSDIQNLSEIGTQGDLSMGNDASGVYYETPRLAGFRANVTYKPTNAIERSNLDSGFANRGGLNDIWGFGLDYSNSFGPVDVAVGAAYEMANDSDNATANAGATTANSAEAYGNEDPEVYTIGLQVGFAGVRFGGGYGLYTGQQADIGADVQTWNVGATYGIGPVTIGAAYSRADIDDYNTSRTAATNPDTRTNGGSTDTISIDGTYAMGPGIDFETGFQYNTLEHSYISGNPRDATYSNVAMGMGFALSF